MKSLVSPRGNFQAIVEIFALLTRHRQLTWEMTKREFTDRYTGQIFGTFWAIGHPLLLISVYVFVFAFVFKQKIGGTADLPLDYTTYLLCGLIPWMSFQESMNKSASVIVGHSNLVKQVVFPIEILPVKGVISSFLTQLVTTAILIIYVLFSHGGLLWTYILIPVLFAFQLLAMIGVSYIFASVGAYFRDLKDFVQIFGTIGMYIMPIFYLPDQVPKLFRSFLYLNPFSYLAWCYQDVFYFGRFEHPWSWVVFITLSVVIFSLGYRVFRKLKLMFGNVL
jgi:lipopolysaccharide transport system permease protein